MKGALVMSKKDVHIYVGEMPSGGFGGDLTISVESPTPNQMGVALNVTVKGHISEQLAVEINLYPQGQMGASQSVNPATMVDGTNTFPWSYTPASALTANTLYSLRVLATDSTTHATAGCSFTFTTGASFADKGQAY
jgi:hypothetical protein